MSNPTLFVFNGNGSLAATDRAGALTLTGSGAMRYRAAENARTNYVTNPSMVTDTTNWEKGGAGGTMARTADSDFLYGYCCLINEQDASQGAIIRAQVRDRAVASQTFTISFDAKLISGDSDWQVRIQSGTATSASLGSGAVTTFVPTATKTRFVFVMTAPSNAGAHGVRAYIQRTGSTDSTIHVGEAMIEAGTTDGSWFAPVWLDPITGILGTAHASPSVSRATAWGEEGTTNTIPDPSFENATITDYWTAQASAGISKVTTHAYNSSNGGKVVCTASTSDGIHQLATSGAAASNGQSWTLSGRIRAFAAGDVGDVVKPAIIERTSGDVVVATNLGSSITLTDAWQEFTYTVTLAGGGTVAKVTMGMMNGAAVACDWVIDALQLENKAYATSPAIGDIGTGYAFSGTAHASSSTRTACDVSVTTTGTISSLVGAAAVRCAPTNYVNASASISGRCAFYTSGAGVGKDEVAVEVSTTQWGAWHVGNAGSGVFPKAGTAAKDTWDLIVTDWNGTAVNIYADGATGAATRTAASGDCGSLIYIGRSQVTTATKYMGGVGPVAIFSRPLTARERAILNASPLWYMVTLAGQSDGLLLTT